MDIQTIGETMYRKPSEAETKLASTIRKYTSGPCWPRDDEANPAAETSAEKSVPVSETSAVQIERK